MPPVRKCVVPLSREKEREDSKTAEHVQRRANDKPPGWVGGCEARGSESEVVELRVLCVCCFVVLYIGARWLASR